MITGINELKISAKNISCKCKCKFDGSTFNWNQDWNSNKCQCECKNSREYNCMIKILYLESCYM